MGLFSFIGKAAKAVGGLVGGPVGGALKLAGGLVDHKGGATAHTAIKYRVLAQQPPQEARGKAPSYPVSYGGPGRAAPVYIPRQVLSASPVMPGGGVATPSGVISQNSAAPPPSYGRSGTSPSRRRSKKSATRAGTSRKKKSAGRKLKFGSPAWRARYLKHKRKKR